MSDLELIEAEVAEIEAKRAHSVLLERAAKAIIEYGKGCVESVSLYARVNASSKGQIEKSVTIDVNYRILSGFTRHFSTLSECLREVAAEIASQQKGGER